MIDPLIVDDHTIFRAGLARCVGGGQGMAMVIERLS